MADTAAPVPVVFKKRTSKTQTRKRVVAPVLHDSDSEGFSSAEETLDTVPQVKRRRKAGITATSATAQTHANDSTDLKPTEFAASHSTNINDTNDATKASVSHDDPDLSSASLLGKSSFAKPPDGIKEPAEGIYRGKAAYESHIQKSQSALEKKSMHGPIKAPPSNIRTITVTDFAPDVCKDYKQTGFCGFGDSCKFLHAREDYKQGWQLDKEWEKVNTGKKSAPGQIVGKANRATESGGRSGDGDEAELEALKDIPFKCIICKSSYKNPVVTKCGHYFCEKCALGRYRKSPKCAACGNGTNGVFNAAKELKRLLDRKAERLAVEQEQES